LGPGAFGENLTVRGTDEDEVAIGDRWSIGEVIVEVSKPRTPCNRLAWRHDRSDLIHRVRETGRSGWYLRVLQEAWLEAGMPIELQARPHPMWTVRRTAQVMANHQSLRQEAAALAQLPALAADWRYRLAKFA
ncbi:MAG TPA: MOSC domain-containing protein, partial [Gemmatimonadales bacterium]|nr:MOSC domain-containing protein [Gemmatimonadales bacterium]